MSPSFAKALLFLENESSMSLWINLFSFPNDLAFVSSPCHCNIFDYTLSYRSFPSHKTLMVAMYDLDLCDDIGFKPLNNLMSMAPIQSYNKCGPCSGRTYIACECLHFIFHEWTQCPRDSILSGQMSLLHLGGGDSHSMSIILLYSTP